MSSLATTVSIIGLAVGFAPCVERGKAGQARALCALFSVALVFINAALGVAPALAEHRKVCNLTPVGTARDLCNGNADVARDKIALASVGAVLSFIGAVLNIKIDRS